MEKKSARQLYLMRILLEQTDESHALTLQELIEKMDAEGIPVERRAVYADIEALREFGVDVIADKRGRNTYYFVGNRQFQLAELKLLVDSVQASRFITERKSRELIKKLSDLAGELSDSAAAYAIDHKSALDEPLADAKDGIKSGVAVVGDVRYRLTISQGAPKRISGGTLTQGFLAELPKAWTKQKLALHVSGMKNATAEELAEHDLQRETVRAWSVASDAV